MKIFVFSDLWMPFPGGAERLMVNIAHQLKKRGHQIRVLTSYAKAKEVDPDIELIIKDIGVNNRHALGAKILDDEIHAYTPDVMLTHHFFAYQFKSEIFKYKIPVVQVIHNSERLAQAKLAIVNSQFVFERCKPRNGDMVIHPPAFDDIVADTHGDYIGMIKPIEHKGIRFVYQLADALPQKKFLVLKGEWETYNVIENLPNVEFMEPVEDIRDFFKRCKIILMPSLSEDAGTVAQEAAMNGLPCLSSNVMGLLETNGGGMLFPLPLDLQSWAEEIDKLYDYPDYYDTIAARQKKYLKSFNWDTKFDELDQKIKAFV